MAVARSVHPLLLATLLTSVALRSWAQDGRTEKADEVEEVVVIGRSNPVSTVDRAERNQARQVRDIFQGDPSIDVGGGSRNGQRLYLRGIEGSNLSITVDGAQQGRNLYNHRGGLLNVDPEILKRVDIQAGPGGADQGPGALGGAIRFETADAQDRLTNGRRFGGFGRLNYASAQESERISLGGYGLIGENLGLLLHGSVTEYDDLRIGGGDRVPVSGGRDESILVKLSLLDVADHSLRIGYEFNEASGLNFMQRGDYPYLLQPIDFRTRPPQDQTLTRDSLTGRYQYDPANPLIDIRLDAYSSTNDFNAPNSNGERFISDITGGSLRNVMDWSLFGGRAETSIGADLMRDEGTARSNTAAAFHTENENLGLFLQQRLYFERAAVYAGVRRDDYSADYGPRTSEGDAVSFNLGGEFEVIDGLTLFAGYGEAARGSGTLPIHFARNAAASLTFNGAATGTLEPETSSQIEGGARWTASNINQWGGTIRAELTLFQTEIDNAILFRQPGSGGLGGRPITDIYNHSGAVRYDGVEASAQYAVANFSTALRYSSVDIENLPLAPQFIVRAGAPRGDQIVWENRWSPVSSVDFGYTLRRTHALDSVPVVTAADVVYIPKTGYTLHDLRAAWRPASFDNVAVELSIMNVLDERYVAHSTLTQNGLATEEAGRDVRVSVSYRY